VKEYFISIFIFESYFHKYFFRRKQFIIILLISCLHIHARITYIDILIILINKYNIQNVSYFYILLGCYKNLSLDIRGNLRRLKLALKLGMDMKSEDLNYPNLLKNKI
jgi:hypothetical protein